MASTIKLLFSVSLLVYLGPAPHHGLPVGHPESEDIEVEETFEVVLPPTADQHQPFLSLGKSLMNTLLSLPNEYILGLLALCMVLFGVFFLCACRYCRRKGSRQQLADPSPSPQMTPTLPPPPPPYVEQLPSPPPPPDALSTPQSQQFP